MNVFPEPTPNPAAMKFTCNAPVIVSGSKSFSSKEAAAGHPLAAELFALEGVRNVFMFGDFVTVNVDDPAKWDTLLPQVQAVIEKHI